MNLEDIKNNLRKFFRGEETEEGRRLIDHWYHYFDEESNKLSGYSEEEKEKLRNELLAGIWSSTDVPEKRQPNQRYRYCSKRRAWSLRVAAGFIIVLLTVLPVLYFQGTLLPENQSNNPIEFNTASNPTGQTSRIVLADGSTVWLSAASTLRYPDKFEDSLRTVRLTGEAFFDVTRNTDKPFVVSSGALQTRVLGTSFNVRVFEGEEDIQVTVATGRVSVKQKNAPKNKLDEPADSIAVLTPNQQLIFNKNNRTAVTKAVKSTLYTSWKDGKLIFENHSFEEIAQRLERWYGVQIHFADPSLKQIRFKVTFENNSLQHALRMLQVIENFEFEMGDNQVWIKSSS